MKYIILFLVIFHCAFSKCQPVIETDTLTYVDGSKEERIIKIRITNTTDKTFLTWLDTKRCRNEAEMIESHFYQKRYHEYCLAGYIFHYEPGDVDFRRTRNPFLLTKELLPNESFVYYIFNTEWCYVVVVDKANVEARTGGLPRVAFYPYEEFFAVELGKEVHCNNNNKKNFTIVLSIFAFLLLGGAVAFAIKKRLS